MNINHMKYAVEVAKLGSLNKAAEVLLVAQPNISRSIKELEGDLGITIFARSPKGMILTPEGEEFIGYAQNLLKHIEQVEKMYRQGSLKRQSFSVSVPRACYISEAFAQFSKCIDSNAAEILYKETDSQSTIQHVLNNDYKFGIIRCAENYSNYLNAIFEEKGICSELISEFSYSLIMSRENPLANKEKITFDDLSGYIEISHDDPLTHSLPLAKFVKEDFPDDIKRRIFVFERASQFDLLSENRETFMWVTPALEKVLNRYNLVQRKCEGNKKIYKDLLIYRNGYKFSALDKKFLEALKESRDAHFKFAK